MTETTGRKTKENLALKLPLMALSGIAIAAGALAAYWLVHEYFDYHGNKSVTFYIGGMFAGYAVTAPLWWLYRRRYPKTD